MWLSLMVLLLMPLMINVGSAPSLAKVSIDPKMIPEQAGSLGHPGDAFAMTVEIENVFDVWSAGFTVKYAPYGRPLAVSEITEGSFLAEGGYDTSFTFKINKFKGELKVSVTRLLTSGLPIVGASGDGILATFKFNVVEAGSSDIEIVDVYLFDSNFEAMRSNAFGGNYYGVTANLIRVNMPDGRVAHVGDSVSFNSRVVNKGDVNVTVKARFDMERLEDGRRIKIYSGQDYAGGGLGEPLPFEYLYVDGYRENPLIGDTHEWNNEGDSMVGEPDGDYMWANSAYAWSMFYSFEDITLAGREVANVDLYGYTMSEAPSWDFDPYVMPWGAWCDSMGGTMDWAWTGGRYYKGSPYDMPENYIGAAMHTEEGINGAEVFIENYCPSGPEQRIDAMRWKVEFSPITPVIPPEYEVEPYAEFELDPMTIGTTTEDMIGTYVVTATLEYSLTGAFWMEGAKTRTFTFKILP